MNCIEQIANAGSDNNRFQILCETTVSFPQSSRRAELIALVMSELARSIFVTNTNIDNEAKRSEVVSCLMSGSQRCLRLVTLRTPKAHRPHDHVPEYLLCYVVETLECGHTLTVYPQADPLIARRRVCHECESLVSSLPPEKSPHSVQVPAKVVAFPSLLEVA